MSSISHVFVVCAEAGRFADLVSGAAGLGKDVHVVFVGSAEQGREAFAYGARVLHLLPPREGVIFEDYAPSVAAVVTGAGAGTLVLLPADRSGKAMAAKIGAAMGAPVVNEATAVAAEEGLEARHTVYGGLAEAVERSMVDALVVTVAQGVFEAVSAPVEGEVREEAFVPPVKAMRLVESRPRTGDVADIAAASRVIGVGRGFARREDLAPVQELAAAIGAEIGCSRPIAESEQWMGRDRYVGISGVTLTGNVYLALGISGQIQHMAGVRDVKTIVAVNKDKNAPVFACADYGLVGDVNKVVPALVRLLGS